MDLQEDLRSRGFTHLKVRSHGRYDLNPPKLDANRYTANDGSSSSSSNSSSDASSSSSSTSSSSSEGSASSSSSSQVSQPPPPQQLSAQWRAQDKHLSWLFDGKSAPWMAVLKKLLGDDCVCIASGCMLSLPGSQNQPLHQDGPHLSKKVRSSESSDAQIDRETDRQTLSLTN